MHHFDLQRLIVLLWKDLYPVVNIVSAQETCRILKIGFVLSNSYHLHGAYLVTVCNQKLTAVHICIWILFNKYICPCCIKKCRIILGQGFSLQCFDFNLESNIRQKKRSSMDISVLWVEKKTRPLLLLFCPTHYHAKIDMNTLFPLYLRILIPWNIISTSTSVSVPPPVRLFICSN